MVGAVNFFDGKLYLGSAQVVRNAAHGYTVGAATVKMALSVGTHSIVARFLPTASLVSSTSASQTVTITGTAATNITLASATGSGTTTALTATLSAFGATTPTGSVVFQNQTSNAAVGTIALAGTTFTSSFSPLKPFSSLQPESVYALDLNGDGFPDVLAIQNQDNRGASLESYISGGDGTFKDAGAAPHYPTASSSPPVIADYNGDGIPDLAFASNTNFNADPPLGNPYQYEMVIFLGVGDGSFPNVETLIPAPAAGLTLGFAATGDFNGDGIPDLTVTDTTSPTSPILYIFPGKGDGTFGTPITNPGIVGATSLVVQDFNGDGFADMAVTLSNQNAVLILLGKGDGTFQPAVSYPAGTTPVIATTLQSRGNGITDLAVLTQADNSLGVLLGNGDGTFLPQVTYALSVTGETPAQLVAADVTGDGLQDIVALYNSTGVTSPFVGAFAVLAGNGDGTYKALTSYGFMPSSLNPFSIASADFNRDGISDLVVPNGGGYTINVFLSGLEAGVPLTATVYGTGAQQIAAQYSGDSGYSSSTSNAISVTGAGPAPTPTFTLAANPSSLSIAAGTTGTATLSVTPQNGFNSPVTFSCSGLPANSTCSFSPSSVTPNGTAATATLTIATNVQAAANELPAKDQRGALISFALLIGFVPWAGFRVARSRALWAKGEGFSMLLFFAAIVLTATLVAGCSGGSGSRPTTPITPVGTSTVTVNAIQPGPSGISAKAVLTVTITH